MYEITILHQVVATMNNHQFENVLFISKTVLIVQNYIIHFTPKQFKLSYQYYYEIIFIFILLLLLFLFVDSSCWILIRSQKRGDMKTWFINRQDRVPYPVNQLSEQMLLM